MFHPNDEARLRDMLNIKQGTPFPPTVAALYARARYLSERIGTGSMQDGALINLVMMVQEAEAREGRPMPGLPPVMERPVPQHQRLPKSMQQALDADQSAEVEKRGPGRPRKEPVGA